MKIARISVIWTFEGTLGYWKILDIGLARVCKPMAYGPNPRTNDKDDELGKGISP